MCTIVIISIESIPSNGVDFNCLEENGKDALATVEAREPPVAVSLMVW